MALALAALVMTPTPAGAQAFGPGACGGGCFYADNSTETYYYYNLTIGSISAIDTARWNKLEPTDMTTQVQTSWNNDTDIIVQDDNYGKTSWWGVWACDVMVSGSTTKCNRGHIIFNTYYDPANVPIACQEQGHAIGLDHSATTNSCMYQNANIASSNYDAHDLGHINGYY